MVWVIARTPAEAQAFMKLHPETTQWKYLGHYNQLPDQDQDEMLTIVLVEGWTERTDAGLLRIHFEHHPITVIHAN